MYCAYFFKKCSASALVVHTLLKCGVCFININSQLHCANNIIELKDLSLGTLFCFGFGLEDQL